MAIVGLGMTPRPIVRCKAPPDRVVVSFCQQCGQPQCAVLPDARGLLRDTICSFCVDGGRVVTVRYQLSQRRGR